MIKHVVIGNNQEWCYYSWAGYISNNSDFITFYNSSITVLKSSLLTNLCYSYFFNENAFLSKKLFAPIYYWLLFKALRSKNEGLSSIVIYDWSKYTKDLNFFIYLKKKMPSVKLVYMFSNIVSISGAKRYGVLHRLSEVFDYVYAFDKLDAQKLGFRYHPLIYYGVKQSKNCKFEYDVFYVGNAKDRLKKLHEVYKKCIDAKLKCKFYIVGVSSDEQEFEGIEYNHTLSYAEVLGYMAKSKCILDIIQGNSSAMTIKVCEAVVYDKKLITTNNNIKAEGYYNSNNILVYDENCTSEIIKEHINKPVKPYSSDSKNQFSPDAFLREITL